MKLLIGGSPCTYWSIAQTKNRETEASGMGWQLFCNYAIARDKFQPDYFLYENNKSMAIPIREQITQILGVEPVCINSALVSAQNRQRLYWCGKRRPDGTYEQVPVEQPKDKGILLRDVLESGTCWREKAYTMDANYFKGGNFTSFEKQSGKRLMVAEPVCVAQRGRYTGEGGSVEQHFEVQESGKTNTLTTVQKDNLVAEPLITTPDGKSFCITATEYKGSNAQQTLTKHRRTMVAEPVRLGMTLLQDDKMPPVYEVRDGQITIKDKQYPIKLADGWYIIRKLTVRECMRLQTVPETFEFPVSDTQAYKMLGNGWTVDVIAHILSFCPDITTDPLDVLSMYDGMSCGHIALDKLGANINTYKATEIDKYAIKTATHNFPGIVELGDAFQVREDDWHI